ncbi:response regulator, partial [Psychromonas sp.]|nr:response regulator [Psychromonas sp.]
LVDQFSVAIVREKTRELLKQATLTAQQSSVLKGEFLASMSHEIRTPMNGVLGMLGLLQNSGLNYEQLHKANLAKESAESLLILINDILDFSKVEAGKLELDIDDFNIYQLMGNFTESMAFRAQDKGLEVILDMSSVELSMVKGDQGRIRQILTNIVGNAIKFTETGEVKITVSITIQPSPHLLFTCAVEDTGIGIPEHKIGMLCDSFSQVDTSTTRQYGGTGLGLAISKKLCELMNGEIHISSELGKGSCFTFSVELNQSDNNNKLSKIDLSGLNILVVDDNQSNSRVLRAQLEAWGATVTEAKSAEITLVCCKQRIQEELSIFDIAFIDMEMPKNNGVQLAKTIRDNSLFDDMHMVMMTSLANQDEPHFFQNLGCDAYFPKPTTNNDLFTAISKVLENGLPKASLTPSVTSDTHTTLSVDVKNSSSDMALQPMAEFDRSKTKLLLVEDNLINQQVALELLSEFGFSAEVAENGQVALELLNTPSISFDLILMDCQMPVLDGYKTTQAIRAGEAGEHCKSITVIAMTANAMQGDREKCLSVGMDDYIAKPIVPHLLKSTLDKWLLHDDAVSLSTSVMKLADENEVDEIKVSWDFPSLLRRLLGKEKLLVNLLFTFKQEMPSYITLLKSHIENEEHEYIRSIAHTIKGAASNLSGIALTTYASELEQVAEEMHSEKYPALFILINDAYQELDSNIALYIAKYTTEKQDSNVDKALTTEQIKIKLTELLHRLKASDFIDVEEVEILISASNKPELVTLLDKLSLEISMFDLATATDTTELIIELLNNQLDDKSEC